MRLLPRATLHSDSEQFLSGWRACVNSKNKKFFSCLFSVLSVILAKIKLVRNLMNNGMVGKPHNRRRFAVGFILFFNVLSF
jgi:hypothetical protein